MIGHFLFNQDDINSDINFGMIYKKCKKYTMTTKECMYALHEAIKYLIKAKISGDFVECGVWKGGSIIMMAYTLNNLQIFDRKIYLYDTFKGMSRPTREDWRLVSHDVALSKWKRLKREKYNDWCYSPLKEVKQNVFSTSYPKDKFVFVKGKVENTMPKILPLRLSLIRLDTDWYNSTHRSLTYLFPLLNVGGVLLIDDYGYWAGTKKAVDEFISSNNISIYLSRIDQTARIGIKLKD